MIDWDDYEDHMLWYDDGIKHRLRLRPQWTTPDAKDLFDDSSKNEAYNESIRELQGRFREYRPLMNIVVSCFYLFSTDGWMKSTLVSVTHLLFCSLRS